MGQELMGLRMELSEVRLELGGVAHLRVEIANLTTALRHSQIPKAATGDAHTPGPSVRVREVDVHKHTGESPVPRDPTRGKAHVVLGEEDVPPCVSIHERLNLGTRQTATNIREKVCGCILPQKPQIFARHWESAMCLSKLGNKPQTY